MKEKLQKAVFFHCKNKDEPLISAEKTNESEENSKAPWINCEFVESSEILLEQADLKGLYYQIFEPQEHLLSIIDGEIFAVAVDIRENSPDFGRWIGEMLTDENNKQLWIPKGYAFGYLTLSSKARIKVKSTYLSNASYRRCIRFDDPDLKIKWPVVVYEFPVGIGPVLSEKDKMGSSFKNAEKF